jgi:hypothetical protein
MRPPCVAVTAMSSRGACNRNQWVPSQHTVLKQLGAVTACEARGASAPANCGSCPWCAVSQGHSDQETKKETAGIKHSFRAAKPGGLISMRNRISDQLIKWSMPHIHIWPSTDMASVACTSHPCEHNTPTTQLIGSVLPSGRQY